MRRLSDQTVAAFYDKLSVHYDVMTGFTERFAREGTTFRELINRYRISSAVDAGCGSGFHSCLLAQLGVDVTGVDVSPAMLSLAATHARERNVDVKFIESSFEDIPAKVKATMDGIFCLGNSLPHLPSREGVRKALRSFLAVLKPGGGLVYSAPQL